MKSMQTRVYEILAEGPATTAEIALELGISQQAVNHPLNALLKAGLAVRQQFYTGRQVPCWLWALPYYGEAAA